MVQEAKTKSSQDKTITEPRKSEATEEEENAFYKLKDGKKYYRVILDKNIVEALTEAYGTGEDVEEKHEQIQEEYFKPMYDALDNDVVNEERLEGKYGFLEEKVEGIRKEYRERVKDGKNVGREISANKAFDIAVKWWTNKS